MANIKMGDTNILELILGGILATSVLLFIEGIDNCDLSFMEHGSAVCFAVCLPFSLISFFIQKVYGRRLDKLSDPYKAIVWGLRGFASFSFVIQLCLLMADRVILLPIIMIVFSVIGGVALVYLNRGIEDLSSSAAEGPS